MPIADLFWSRVDRRGPDDCWPWKLRPDSSGYGRMRVGGKLERAPRIAWWLTHERWPVECRHRCDHPICCNPAHLLDGTRTDNMADREARGRTSHGEAHPGAKMTAANVKEARRLRAAGMLYREIAARFGVNTGTIWNACNGKRWRRAA